MLEIFQKFKNGKSGGLPKVNGISEAGYYGYNHEQNEAHAIHHMSWFSRRYARTQRRQDYKNDNCVGHSIERLLLRLRVQKIDDPFADPCYQGGT